MRKSINRTTVLIVLAIFLSISVGYALFSDTITIEGTATAQGNFDIEASCLTNVTPDMLYEFGFEDYVKDDYIEPVAERFKGHGYKDESCIVSDDKVTYSVGLEYPTATKHQWIKMKNNGNISAYLDSNLLVSQFEHNIVKKYDAQNNLIETINTTEDGRYPFLVLSIGEMVGQNAEGIYYNFNENEEEFMANFTYINEETGEFKIILEPGESLYVPLVAYWNDHFTENNVKYEAIGTFEIDWQQYTD